MINDILLHGGRNTKDPEAFMIIDGNGKEIARFKTDSEGKVHLLNPDGTPAESGGKIYLHKVTLVERPNVVVGRLCFYSSSLEPITNIGQLYHISYFATPDPRDEEPPVIINYDENAGELRGYCFDELSASFVWRYIYPDGIGDIVTEI